MLLALPALVAWQSACAGSAAKPPKRPLAPLPAQARALPGAADHAARDLAKALWLDDKAGAAAQVQRVRELPAADARLLPYALDAENALQADRGARRRATSTLLKRDDLDAGLRARLEMEAADSPLLLARKNLGDARVRRWGGVTNTLAGGIGTSLENPLLLPTRIAQTLLHVAVGMHLEDELSASERRALEYWKRFAEQNPDAEESRALFDDIEAMQQRWFKTKHEQNLRSAREALEKGDPAYAEVFAQRALRYAPGDAAAHKVLARAKQQQDEIRHARARALQAAPDDTEESEAERALLLSLWQPGADLESAARALLAGGPKARKDEARFALALALAEQGRERESWAALAALARRDPQSDNMARHARALVYNLESNPYGGFREARAAVRSERARRLLFGVLADGARDRELPRALEWLIEIPSLPGVVLGLPQRLITFPFSKTERSAPGVMARRYLARMPEGVHAQKVRRWLLRHERGRGNHYGAWQIALALGEHDAAELAELRERAAQQAFERAEAEKRRSAKMALLREVAREFPGTDGGKSAGLALREALQNYTPQRIRISRAFLKENANVAGAPGLALKQSLLDGKLENGELHAHGVTLLGGRMIELAFVAEGGDEEDAPEPLRRRISRERLERTVAQLEESALHAWRSDRDLEPEHDADRDAYLERARLGVVDQPERRPDAGAEYSYLSARERFGAVRSRESLLPVELVLRGSFSDFSLGAFPRIRLPQDAQDSILYE